MVAEDQLEQIRDAIRQLQQWNVSIKCADDYALSPDGMKTLAATCMLIEAIGEGVKKIDNLYPAEDAGATSRNSLATD